MNTTPGNLQPPRRSRHRRASPPAPPPCLGLGHRRERPGPPGRPVRRRDEHHGDDRLQHAARASTPTGAAALQYNREEERLARDVYAALADRYDGAAPFSMITRSEQTHYDAIGVLLDRYGIERPGCGPGRRRLRRPDPPEAVRRPHGPGDASPSTRPTTSGSPSRSRTSPTSTGSSRAALPADVAPCSTSLRAGSEQPPGAPTSERRRRRPRRRHGYGTGRMGRRGDSSDDTTPPGVTDGWAARATARGAPGPWATVTCLLTDDSV